MLVVECQKETKITNCWCHDAMFKRKELYEFLCEKYKNQVDMSTQTKAIIFYLVVCQHMALSQLEWLHGVCHSAMPHLSQKTDEGRRPMPDFTINPILPFRSPTGNYYFYITNTNYDWINFLRLKRCFSLYINCNLSIFWAYNKFFICCAPASISYFCNLPGIFIDVNY